MTKMTFNSSSSGLHSPSTVRTNLILTPEATESLRSMIKNKAKQNKKNRSKDCRGYFSFLAERLQNWGHRQAPQYWPWTTFSPSIIFVSSIHLHFSVALFFGRRSYKAQPVLEFIIKTRKALNL